MRILKRGTTLAAAMLLAFVITAVPSIAAPVNLFANPSAEQPNPLDPTQPASWTHGSWGANTASFSYLSSGLDGSRSLRVDVSDYSSGDAKWVPDPVAVQPNADYVYTDQYKASVPTHVVYMALDANGNASYDDVGINVPASSTTAKGFTGVIHTPANTVKLSVLHLVESSGWLVVDNVSLTSNQVQYTDLVPNNSVETPDPASATAPQSWSSAGWGTNTRKFSYVSGDGANGSRSVQACITKYGTDPAVAGDAKWMFAGQPLSKGTDYRATFKYKTNALPKVHVVAHFVRADGSEKFFGMPDPEPVGNTATSWTQYSDVFNVPQDAQTADVFMFIAGVGCVSVDDMHLTPYTYTGFDKARISLTFDDAPDINAANALPVLNQYGFKTTEYLPTKTGTDSSGWIEGNKTMQAIVKKYAATGHEIASHTITHPHLPTLACPGTSLTNELSHPQTFLRQLTGQPITDFASPYGEYSACVNTQIAKYYGSHRTTDEGFNSKDNFNAYRLRVQNMTPTTTLAEFKGWVQKAIADRTWLILVYHNVDDPANPDQAPDPFDTYLPDFKDQMAYLSTVNIAVKRVDTALTELHSQLN
jgi:peptidoglycan/xylan/chitin deacetylase (PgdA/CDA1 family)